MEVRQTVLPKWMERSNQTPSPLNLGEVTSRRKSKGSGMTTIITLPCYLATSEEKVHLDDLSNHTKGRMTLLDSRREEEAPLVSLVVKENTKQMSAL